MAQVDLRYVESLMSSTEKSTRISSPKKQLASPGTSRSHNRKTFLQLKCTMGAAVMACCSLLFSPRRSTSFQTIAVDAFSMRNSHGSMNLAPKPGPVAGCSPFSVPCDAVPAPARPPRCVPFSVCLATLVLHMTHPCSGPSWGSP